MQTRTEQRQGNKNRRWLKWLFGVLIALLLIGGVFLYLMWGKIHDTISTMHNPLERDSDPERQSALKSLFEANESINVLLLGVDERKGDKGRSDTMILMSLNPKTNSTVMLSIPRDTYVSIPGHGMDKINHAYAYGDVPLSLQTVENTFNLHVHFYIRVNMEGFKDGIDALGGITVNNKRAFSQGGRQFSKGKLHLNGDEALEYIRMRKEDPRGDLGRNERQRDVIKAAMDEAASFSNITKAGEILNIVGGNVQTNMDMDTMRYLFSDYRGTRKTVKTLEAKGTGQRINGVWYYVVSDEEFGSLSSEIKKHMEEK